MTVKVDPYRAEVEHVESGSAIVQVHVFWNGEWIDLADWVFYQRRIAVLATLDERRIIHALATLKRNMRYADDRKSMFHWSLMFIDFLGAPAPTYLMRLQLRAESERKGSPLNRALDNARRALDLAPRNGPKPEPKVKPLRSSGGELPEGS
jgi:hypothetical protein